MRFLEISRRRAGEEADLTAELAALFLRAPDVRTALPAAAQHLARIFRLPSASIVHGSAPGDGEHVALPLRGDGTLATLIVPSDLAGATLERLRERVVPSLEVLLRAARDRENTVADALRAGREELRRVVEEQTALRGLATLAARSVLPEEVLDGVAREMGHILGARYTVIARYEADGTATIQGIWNFDDVMPLGSRWPLDRGTVMELVCRTGTAGRINAIRGSGKLADMLRERGIISAVGCPIVVGRRLWGAAIAASNRPEPLPEGTEERMRDFTELAAVAIAKAQSHADLKASRARVVAAADETRRRIERDLHDGTQQRLVSIGLEMRALEAAMPPGLDGFRDQLSRTAHALEEAVADLQEISRGLHPALLAKSGLPSALKALARRSTVAVELDVSAEQRLPDRLEVNVYYVISEALLNAAKHAHATLVHVELAVGDSVIRLSVRDDGVGGADPACGSGLLGLTDRIEALGGKLKIVSPAGEGTSLFAEIPTDDAHYARGGIGDVTRSSPLVIG